jgi:hypothetical protein
MTSLPAGRQIGQVTTGGRKRTAPPSGLGQSIRPTYGISRSFALNRAAADGQAPVGDRNSGRVKALMFFVKFTAPANIDAFRGESLVLRVSRL